MLEDSAPVAVLAHGSLAARFAVAGVPVLELDADAPAWAAGPETNPELRRTRARGAPAGAPGLRHLHLGLHRAAQGGDGRRTAPCSGRPPPSRRASACGRTTASLQFASVAFDAAVEEIFGALLTGAALVLRTEAWLEGAPAFWRPVRGERG